MLSNTCKYAIRAVIYLAVHNVDDKKIGIKEISSHLEIPTPFLGKILQVLAKHKILLSTKGPHGGFCIGKKLHEISLLNIVEIIDGLDVFNNCVIGMHSCNCNAEESLKCPVHEQFYQERNNLYRIFKNETIEKIVNQVGSNLDFIKL
jgi:Rrf2 family protein